MWQTIELGATCYYPHHPSGLRTKHCLDNFFWTRTLLGLVVAPFGTEESYRNFGGFKSYLKYPYIMTFGIDSSMSILEEKKPEIQPHVLFHLYLGNHVFFLCSIQTHVL